MSVYRRKFKCSVCHTEFTARQIINGWIGTCECPTVILHPPTPDHFEKSKSWERIE